jgi:putative NADH-flavin reductase
MKLVVLGATGGTGLEIVRQAITAGHTVTAFVRSPERLQSFRNSIEIQQGNLLSRLELAKALAAQDAVLSAFGPRVPIAKGDENLLRTFASVLTEAMLSTGIKRLIVESAAFLFKDAIFPPAYLLGKLLFPTVVEDGGAMEQIIQNTPLDWTLVRPPRLTNGPRSAAYRVREGHLPTFGFSISRADVADCFLKVVTDQTTVRKILGVSN